MSSAVVSSHQQNMRVLVRLFLDGVAILVAAWPVPGLQLDGPGSALMA
jgi:hypothetical protein